MTMTAGGLAKLTEEIGELQKELGELQQVVGKKLAYYHTDDHPDGGPPLDVRLAEEIADVMAACEFVAEVHKLSGQRIAERRDRKLNLFRKWHADPSNNEHGVDR